METLGEPILATMQVRDLVPMIHHPKTKDIAGDIIFTKTDDKKELIKIMADIVDKMSVVGVNPGTGGGRAESTTGDTRQIRKLKRKEKALKKKLKQKHLETPHASKLDQDPMDYLPKEMIEAIRKATGKYGSKVVAWAFKGRAADQAKKHSVCGAKTNDGSDGSAKADEEEEPSNSGRSGASASMGQGSNNRHPKNPKGKKRKIDTIWTVSHSIKKATATRHSSDFTKLCRVEVDSRADTCCTRATFCLVEETDGMADVEGFHKDLGKLENIPISATLPSIIRACRRPSLEYSMSAFILA